MPNLAHAIAHQLRLAWRGFKAALLTLLDAAALALVYALAHRLGVRR